MTYAAFTNAEKMGWHERAKGYAVHTALATVQIIPALIDALALRPGQRLLNTNFSATGDDFFDFFMHFGVRVPLIVSVQPPQIQARLRERINADMHPFRTKTGFEISMPSLLYSGTKI